MLVAGQLDNLHQVPLGRGARTDQPVFAQQRPIGIVYLIAVTMALRDFALAIQVGSQRALLEQAREGPQAHGAP